MVEQIALPGMEVKQGAELVRQQVEQEQRVVNDATVSIRVLDVCLRPAKPGVKARVYFWMQESNPVVSLVSGFRFAMPWQKFRDQLPHVLELAGIAPATKFRWSQKAGCHCGCSPGFVVDAVIGYDVHVDYALVDEEVKAK